MAMRSKSRVVDGNGFKTEPKNPMNFVTEYQIFPED